MRVPSFAKSIAKDKSNNDAPSNWFISWLTANIEISCLSFAKVVDSLEFWNTFLINIKSEVNHL